jgi:acyl-coenzyme A synthetase/AMP-(fatty) acid ligase
VSRSALITSHALDAVFAWCPDGPVSVGEFLADATAFAERLPASGDLINLCEDRYRFAVGFAAGLLRGRVSLQPSSLAPQSLRQLAQDHPGALCLTDDTADTPDPTPAAGLTALRVPARPGAGRAPLAEMPLIDDERLAAVLFTSGSTGRPQPHTKHWGRLVRNGRAEAAALGLDREPHVLVGTVPIQHSYGFESTFLLALHGGCSFWSGKPFFAQDIDDALAAVPGPRLLVTTPFHLANWMAASTAAVKPQRLLSATAPLAEGLAQQAEAACGAELHEIYGSTESSALASRRTVLGPAWTLLPGVRLGFSGDVASADGGHVEGVVPLADLIEPLADGRFLLHGRHADLINIAGKRSSLSYLNRQLAGLDGVIDAAFFLPDEPGVAGEAGAITRLVAFAVAPGRGAAELLAELRERVDAIFLPRPLVLLPALPRNATGKLTRDALAALHRREVLHERPAVAEAPGAAVRSAQGRALDSLERDWRVPTDHPAFAGHFPGRPILPGVVLLDEALRAARELAPGARGWTIPQAKFLQPVLPGDALRLSLSALPSTGFAFTFTRAGEAVASGQLRPMA